MKPFPLQFMPNILIRLFLNKILCQPIKNGIGSRQAYFLLLLLIINKAKTAAKQLNTPIHKTNPKMIYSLLINLYRTPSNLLLKNHLFMKRDRVPKRNFQCELINN